MSTKKQSLKQSLRDRIISAYMNEVLEKEQEPKSVFKFCKTLEIEESVFYQNFASISIIKKTIWLEFHKQTLALLKKNKDYEGYATREKLLCYTMTLFEVLKLHRSYVLFNLHEPKRGIENLVQLKAFRSEVKDYVSEIWECSCNEKLEKLKKGSGKLIQETMWMQLLYFLKFWLSDESPDFEKTDILLEKSLTTTFDLINNSFLTHAVDLAKFIWKEKKA